MSAFKKIAGLVAGMSAVGVIGVAVAQGVPPNPHISNPALGAGTQTVQGTPIGETGVLAESDVRVEQTAVITPQADPAVVASQSAPEPQAAAPADTQPQQVAQAPSEPAPSADNTQSMGAGPSEDTSAQKTPRADRG